MKRLQCAQLTASEAAVPHACACCTHHRRSGSLACTAQSRTAARALRLQSPTPASEWPRNGSGKDDGRAPIAIYKYGSGRRTRRLLLRVLTRKKHILRLEVTHHVPLQVDPFECCDHLHAAPLYSTRRRAHAYCVVLFGARCAKRNVHRSAAGAATHTGRAEELDWRHSGVPPSGVVCGGYMWPGAGGVRAG